MLKHMLFALLACAGDMGCMVGPSAVGALSDLLGGSLQIGFLCSCAFPVGMLILVSILQKKK